MIRLQPIIATLLGRALNARQCVLPLELARF